MQKQIIILHGWGKRLERWQKVKKELEKNGWRVFLPTLPGFASAPAPAQAWGVADYAQWMKERLPQNYFLLGHSFGGRIALKIASSNPVGLKGLILVASAGIKQKKKFKKMLFWWGAKIGKIVFFFPPFLFFKALSRRLLYKLSGERDYYQARGVMKKTFQMVVSEDLQSEMKKIKIPTLILWGAKDRLTLLSDGQRMNHLIKNSTLKTFPDEGHDLPFKLSKLMVREINRFYQQQ